MLVRFLLLICLASAFIWPASLRKPGKAPPAGVKTPGVQIPYGNLKADSEFPLPAPPAALASTPAAVYVTAGQVVTSIDPKTNKATELLKGLEKPCSGMVNAFGTLAAGDCGKQAIVRVDAKEKSIKATAATEIAPLSSGLVSTEDSLWVLSDERTTLTRIDPEQNKIVAETRVTAGCTSLISGEGSLWVTCPSEDKLVRIDPRTNLVKERIEIKGKPVAAASGEGSIWVLCKTEGKVARLDPKTNKVTATIELNVPDAAGMIAVAEGSVWVGLSGFPVSRIDPGSDKVVQQFAGTGGGILFAGATSIWVATPGQNTLTRFDPKRIRATLAE